jgi:branched-chain amino acid transport system permease protein
LEQIFGDNKRTVLMIGYGIILVLFLAWLIPIAGQKAPARLLQATITGLLVGGVYALVALGIVVVTKASGVFNFSHGFMMLFGGLIFFSFFTTVEISAIAAFALAAAMVLMLVGAVSFRLFRESRYAIGGVVTVVILTVLMTVGGIQWKWVHAVVGAVVGAILIGLLIERLTIRPLIGQPLFSAVIMTLGLAQLLQGITVFAWGSQDKVLPIFADLQETGIPVPIRIDVKEALGGVIIVRTELLVAFVLAVIAFVGFILFFRYTNIGLAMRATAENQQLAESTGLRVRAILAVVWAIAALLAGVAGVLQGGATSLTQAIPFLGLRAFPALLLGGIESIGGALVGGLVIGVVEQWATLLFPGTQAGTELAPFVVLMVVLVIRPEGLFGEKEIERI